MNDAVAEKVEQLSTYLTNAKADTMLSDLENVARRRPWLVAGAATVLGFALFPLPEGVGPHSLRAGVWLLTAAPRAAFHSTVVSQSTARAAEARAIAGPVPSAR